MSIFKLGTIKKGPPSPEIVAILGVLSPDVQVPVLIVDCFCYHMLPDDQTTEISGDHICHAVEMLFCNLLGNSLLHSATGDMRIGNLRNLYRRHPVFKLHLARWLFLVFVSFF